MYIDAGESICKIEENDLFQSGEKKFLSVTPTVALARNDALMDEHSGCYWYDTLPRWLTLTTAHIGRA